jgi:TRAP-type C4-dicarboxylate transport system permease small subunit
MSSTDPSSLSGGGALIDQADQKLSPVENLFNLVAAVAIVALMFLGVVQIGLRTIFNFPIEGYIDLVELSMALLAFLGAAYCQRLGGHIRMELLIGRLEGRALWIAEAIGTAVAMLIIGVLIWYSSEHFWRAFTLGDTTIDAEYPVWPSKLVVPIAFTAWFLRLAIQFFGSMRMVIYPDAPQAGVILMKDVAEQARDEIRETFGEDALGELAEQNGNDQEGRSQ